VLVLNLGGEMIFILHQRLVANHFSPEQTVSALSELLHKLFCPELQNELWRQRELYGYHSMKRLFYKLLDSSPIKIAENSFDKVH
jgi:hypothetical protein